MTPAQKHVRLPLPASFTRCLGHGPCCIAHACARHVTMQRDKLDGRCTVQERVCRPGSTWHAFLPLEDKVLMP